MLNKKSNRSHCIFTLEFEQRSRLGVSDQVKRSKLQLVDLAGSERLKKTMSDSHDDIIAKESMYINRSLTYLEQCVVALTSKERSHIPYRQTKLTHVLKDSLGGNCRTLLIACIWGETAHLEETISTLKLAARMMRVTNNSEINTFMDPGMVMKKYEQTIKELKMELMMHDTLANRSGIVYTDYTPEQKHDLLTQVKAYVSASPAEEESLLPVQSIRQVREIYRTFKLLMKNMESEVEERLRENFTLAPHSDRKTTGGIPGTAPGDSNAVGELDESGGFGIGKAPSEARPSTIENNKNGGSNNDSKAKKDISATNSPKSNRTSPKHTKNVPVTHFPAINSNVNTADREAAFATFKSGPGRSLNEGV